MARNQVAVHVTPDDWVELTGGDATKISFQIVSTENVDTDGIWVRASTAGNPGTTYGWRYYPKDRELNRTITDYVAGAAVAVDRVWAKAVREACVVLVSDDSA